MRRVLIGLVCLLAGWGGGPSDAFVVLKSAQFKSNSMTKLFAEKKKPRARRADPNRPQKNVWEAMEDYMDETWHPRNQPPIVDKDWRGFRAEMIATYDVTASESDSYAHLNSTRWAHTLARLETGCVLVSSPDIGGDFEKTVVLLFSHNKNGSYGAILNQPSEETTEKLLADSPSGSRIDEDLQEALKAMPAHMGGPVEKQMLTLVHNSLGMNGSVTLIQGEPGIYVGGFDGIKEKSKLDRMPHNFRGKVLFGHAAWSPGQLQREMVEGKWFMAALSPDLVLDPCEGDRGADELWDEIVRYLTYPELVKHQGKRP